MGTESPHQRRCMSPQVRMHVVRVDEVERASISPSSDSRRLARSESFKAKVGRTPRTE